MILKKYKKEIIDIIHKYLPDTKIYLFGSRARSSHQTGADVDLAFDIGKKIDERNLLKIKDEIEETNMPLFVDLVDLHSCSQDFIDEINKDWILWES